MSCNLNLLLSYFYLGQPHFAQARSPESPSVGETVRLYHDKQGEEATLDFMISPATRIVRDLSSFGAGDESATTVAIELGEPVRAVAES